MWSSTTPAPHAAALGALAALLASTPGTVSAQAQQGLIATPPTTVSARPQTGDLLEWTVCGPSATFNLKLSTKSPAMIELPRGIRSVGHAKPTPYSVLREGNKVYVAPPATAKKGDEFAVRIWGADKDGKQAFEASLHTSVVKHLEGVHDNVVIYHQSDTKRFGDRPGDNPCVLHRDGSINRLRARAQTRQQTETASRGLPVIDHVAKSGEALDVAILLAEWEDDDMVIDFRAVNPWFQPSQLTEIRVRDRRGDSVQAELIYPVRPAVATGKKTDKSELATIGGRDSMGGSILLPDALTKDLESLEISFHGIKGGAAYSTAVQVVRFQPVTPLSPEERSRRRRARQIGLGVHFLGGGVWLPDGADMGRLDMTGVTGLTVAFQKGYENGLALEVEATGGWTGEARFSSVSWEGEDGDIMRTATMGRLQAGGAIRLGDKYMTSLRAGLGVQGVSYDSRFVGTDGTRTGPGNSFDIGLAAYVGGSFSARLGDNWSLGINGAFTEAFTVKARTLEAGLHVRYGWNMSKPR